MRNPAESGEKILCAGDGTLLNYMWLLKKKRQNSDSTIKLRVRILNMLKKKGANLADPDTVETVLAVEPLTPSQKYEIARCYKSYTKMMKIPWESPKIKYEPKQPFMPTHEEITALIYAANRQMSTFLQVALTTVARCGEIAALRWTDINTDKSMISINYAEKGSRNRTIKVPEKTIVMVNALSKNMIRSSLTPKLTHNELTFAFSKIDLPKHRITQGSSKSISTLLDTTSPLKS